MNNLFTRRKYVLYFGVIGLIMPFLILGGMNNSYVLGMFFASWGVLSVIVIRDIGKNKKREELLCQELESLRKRNSDLEEMSAMMAHDLKRPLRTIGSFIQLTKRRLPPFAAEDIREYLNFINGSVNSMSDLLNAIMSYSQLTQEKVRKEEVILDVLLDEVKLNIYDTIKDKEAEIYTFNLPVIKANRTQLMFVFQNLLENAIIYNENRPKIIIESEERDEDYIISVRDNGIGISREYQEKVFGMFQRLNPQTYKGSGIGLASCKKIIEQHGGEIWLDSEEGRGTTFYFSMSKMPEESKKKKAYTRWLKAS